MQKTKININEKKKELNYSYCQKILKEKYKDKNDYRRIIELLSDIKDYKDSADIIAMCEDKLNKKNNFSLVVIIDIIIASLFVITLFIIPNYIKNKRYDNVEKLYEQKQYAKVIDEVQTLGNYKNCEKMYIDSAIALAKNHVDEKQYDKAIDILMPISGYSKITQYILEIYYKRGMDAYENKDLYTAIKYLDRAHNYKDSSDFILDIKKEYIYSNSDKTDTILLGFIQDLKYTKYAEDSKKRLKEVFGWTGTLKLADEYGNEIFNTTIPNQFKLILQVWGGLPEENAVFSWYEYNSNYELNYTGTQCTISDSEKCLSRDRYLNNKVRGYAVYYKNVKDGYMIADIKW